MELRNHACTQAVNRFKVCVIYMYTIFTLDVTSAQEKDFTAQIPWAWWYCAAAHLKRDTLLWLVSQLQSESHSSKVWFFRMSVLI